MLVPQETILQMEQDGMASDEIAIARNVSERAASWHLKNRQAPRARVPREGARDAAKVRGARRGA
ncbi:MAG: hypothetical protein JO320_05620, partial [Alphaproteobacteria bacterium]|nr:hypothetical protein [Alphaproteobacteria bacterium]